MAMLRTKKFFASRFGDTRYGRQKVAESLGERAQALLGAIISSTDKFANESLGASIRKDLIKLILKVALLWKEKKIVEKDAEPAREPVIMLAQTLIEYLSRASTTDASDVCRLVHNVGDATVTILKPHMKEKTWSKVQVFSGFYGSSEFAQFFLQDDSVASERSAVLEILQALLPERAKRQVCAIAGCTLPRASLPGATYCMAHHAVKFSVSPVLDDFLRNSEYLRTFREYILDCKPEKAVLLEFYAKANDFKSTTRRSVLEERGPQLFRRYIHSEALQPLTLQSIPNSKVAQVVTHTDQELQKDPGRSCIFNDIIELVIEELESMFETDFKSSTYFQQWADINMTLPVPEVPEQRKALFEQLGLDVSSAYSVASRPRSHGSFMSRSISCSEPSPKAMTDRQNKERSATFAEGYAATSDISVRGHRGTNRSVSLHSNDSSSLSKAYLATVSASRPRGSTDMFSTQGLQSALAEAEADDDLTELPN